MIRVQDNLELSKSKGLVLLEYVLLAVCLCVIALRATLTESIDIQSASQSIHLGGRVYSLAISAVLIFALVLWLICSFWSKRFIYRFSAIEIGLCFFLAGAIIAGLAAPDKRAVITNVAMFIAPLMMAVLLLQILDSQSKIKLLLVVIGALGVVSAYQCADQFFYSNQITIDQYEQAPETVLEPLGIETDTFRHMLFEHRLYSRGVRGFFTTKNSAGSFAILASFAAAAIFIEKLRNRKSKATGIRELIACGIAVVIVVFGFAVTRSKGAIGGFSIAAAMFVAYLLFGDRLKTHKKAILIILLLLAIGCGGAVISYGLTHGRLPGGNSMLVRWQYWHSTAKMYADYPLTGIGPGNFTYFYSHHKPAAALETVADPHNFALSTLAQYGPVGLVGFLAMLFVPLWRVIFPRPAPPMPPAHRPKPIVQPTATILLIVISIGLLVFRPMVLKMPPNGPLDVKLYVLFILYVTPVIFFAIGFLLLRTNEKTADPTANNTASAALFCAVLGVLIHNTTDFAIFEPGVSTGFWAIIASLIALNSHQKCCEQFVIKPSLFSKMLVTAAGLALFWAYLNYAFIPVVKSTAKIQQSRQATLVSQFEQASALLASAAEDDPLNPTTLKLSGQLYLQRFQNSKPKQVDLMFIAEQYLLKAIERNRADFGNFERLAGAYALLAENLPPQAKTEWLNKAFDYANQAVERYPGSGRLHLQLAQIAERLGRTDTAIEHYRKAVEIEDAYRRQFQIMYPGRKIFSRLGEEKYNSAKKRIEHLSKQPTP